MVTPYASAIQIVRPVESIADTQPQLQPTFVRLSAMISQSLTRLFGVFAPDFPHYISGKEFKK
jgi:hypothetical protein